MNRFFKLVFNEEMKIYIRKSTWVMYAILAAIIIGSGLISYFFGDLGEEYTGDDWREVLEEENEEYMQDNEEWIQEMDDDNGFVVEMNNSYIAKNNYYLENDIQPKPYDAWEYVLENVFLLSVVSLFTIIVAAGIVAHEFRWGTIKLLLSRPISRAQILLSKYVSVLIFALFTLLFVVLFSWIVGAILFGINGINPSIVIEQNDEFAQVSILSEIMSGYGYKLINLIMMATFAFMISSIFRNSTLAIGTAIFLMFAGNSIVGFFSDHDWAKYILFANTDLKQYANDGSPIIEGMTLGFSITMLVVYYAIFLVLSWVVFTRRDVAGQ